MDHIGCGVQQPDRSPRDDFSRMIDLDQITGFDLAKGNTEWVHPECVRIDRITQGDVTGDTLIEAVLAEDAEGSGEAALEVLAFLIGVVKFRRTWKLRHWHSGLVWREDWFGSGC
jgi:hypothetical protein